MQKRTSSSNSSSNRVYENYAIGSGKLVINLMGSHAQKGDQIINNWNNRGCLGLVVPNEGKGNSPFLLQTKDGVTVAFINSGSMSQEDVQRELQVCRKWHKVVQVDYDEDL